MRSMRQYVLPAPGPASTSAGPSGASIAARCEDVALKVLAAIRLPRVHLKFTGRVARARHTLWNRACVQAISGANPLKPLRLDPGAQPVEFRCPEFVST